MSSGVHGKNKALPCTFTVLNIFRYLQLLFRSVIMFAWSNTVLNITKKGPVLKLFGEKHEILLLSPLCRYSICCSEWYTVRWFWWWPSWELKHARTRRAAPHCRPTSRPRTTATLLEYAVLCSRACRSVECPLSSPSTLCASWWVLFSYGGSGWWSELWQGSVLSAFCLRCISLLVCS